MAEYVLAFRQSSSSESTPESEQAWGEWFNTIGSQVANFGNRVGETAMVGGPPSDAEALSGYIVVNAADLGAAVEIANGCPGLDSGGRVEVGTVIPAQ